MKNEEPEWLFDEELYEEHYTLYKKQDNKDPDNPEYYTEDYE